VDIVAKSLKRHGFDAAAIHGDLDQSVRTRTLAAFRNGELKLLVASDVAARGLDIPDVSHVFNYDVPHHADDYVHRIGRTGRAGRLGEAFMIVTPTDDKSLDKVLKLIKKEPVELPLEGIDFSAIKDQPRREGRGGDKGRRGRGERSGRGRGDAPAPEAVAAATSAPAPVAAPDAPASDAPPPRRSRSRRSTAQAAESAAAPAVGEPVEAAAAPEADPRPAGEPRRGRGERRAETPAAGGDGRPFGEAEIPAFLRRPVPIKV